MLNLLTKSWIAVSLLATTAAFAQASNNNGNCPPAARNQGHEMSKCQMMAGYNAPARFELKNSWEIYATGSFIYWQARQENIEIGLISQNDPNTIGDTPFGTSYVNNMTVTQPNFTFRPGVKLGLGANLDWDDWEVYGEYTWFHGSIESGVKPLAASTTGTSIPPNGRYLYPIQGSPGAESNLFYQDADQSWTLKMDFLDISLARAYYSGTKLTVCPFVGVRAGWIRQHLRTTYVGSTNYVSTFGFLQTQLSDHFNSWGVGPLAGFESNWLLGYGFRFIGSGSADILCTRYHVHQNEQTAHMDQFYALFPITSNTSVSQKVDYLRTHLDAELGFGWGMYCYDYSWHVDLSATYGFQVFWDQNMFRNFESSSAQAKSFSPNGNLFVHGLTMNARFDF